MGLDAFVHCRCFLDGLATPAPTAVEYGPEGLTCADVLPIQGLLAFDRWLETGCDHPGMLIASSHIANWGTYRSFQSALSHVGLDRFPTLARELPNANGGTTQPTAASDCLTELSIFESSGVSWPSFHLIDADTGTVIGSRVEAYDGVFVLSGSDHLEAGIAPSGVFFVRRSNDRTGELLFSAEAFTQRVIEARAPGRDLVKLESDDGQRIVMSGGLNVDEAQDLRPMSLRVIAETHTPDTFAAVVNALRRVFTASTEAEMPTHWT